MLVNRVLTLEFRACLLVFLFIKKNKQFSAFKKQIGGLDLKSKLVGWTRWVQTSCVIWQIIIIFAELLLENSVPKIIVENNFSEKVFSLFIFSAFLSLSLSRPPMMRLIEIQSLLRYSSIHLVDKSISF